MAITLDPLAGTSVSTPPEITESSPVAPNPLLSTFGESPWDVAEAEYEKSLAEWHAKTRDRLDGIALDPDSYFRDKDMGPDPDTERTRMHVINGGTLEFLLDRPISDDPTSLLRKLAVQEASIRFYGGRAKDEAGLLGEIRAEAQGRRDSREMGKDLVGTASREAFMAREDLGYTAEGETPDTFRNWKDANRGKPGYDATKEPDYFEAWHAVQAAVKEQVDHFRAELDNVWRAFVRKEDYGKAAEDAYYSLPDERKPAFMAALALRAKTLPEKEQATFWGNFQKQAGRDIKGFFESADAYFVELAAPAAMATTPPNLPENRMTMDLPGFMADVRKARDFKADVARVQQAAYDPMTYLAPDGSWSQVFEKGAYGAPGAIVTSASAAVPVLGQAAFYGSSRESIYQEYRQDFQNKGMSYDQAAGLANKLAPVAAVPQVLMERLQLKAISGRLPVLDKVLNGMLDKVSSRVARFGLRTAVAVAEEGSLENLQDLVPAMVQDIGHALAEDVPDVRWTGKGGALDGYWTRNAEMMVTMLPLAIFGAAGGISRERRAQAFANASTTELQALGINADGIAAINAAKGSASLNAAVDSAMETRDATTPEAAAAVEELARQQESQRQALEAAKATGMVPTIVQTRQADGAFAYAVLDGETGEEVGTAPDMAGALRVATIHSAFLDDRNADKIAYLATMLEAGEQALELAGDPEAKNTFELGTVFTEHMAAAESPDSIDRFRMQAENRERVNGGDGSVTRIALGRNIPEARGLVRTFTNRLFHGASVQTVVHETGHGMLRRAREAGVITRADELAFVRGVDSIMGETTLKRGAAKGERLALLEPGLSDEQVTQQMLDEAIAEILEAEILRTRKRAREAKPLRVSNGIISRNLLALSRIAPNATAKFRALIEAARGVFGLSSARALKMKQGARAGTFDEAAHEAFLTKLTGRDLQAEHDGMVRDEHAAILGQENFTPTEDAPFSLVPIGPGARGITEAPALLPRQSSFADVSATTPAQWRPVWSKWLAENKATWFGTIVLPEGSVAIDRKTADHVRYVRSGERAGLHFEAAARLGDLLENSVLAFVDSPKPGEESAQEIHRRYGWMVFSDGVPRHVLMTIKRWKPEMSAEHDTAYSVEALEVEENGAADGNSPSILSDDKADTGSARTLLARFLAGIKPEHRFAGHGGDSSPFSLAPSGMVHGLERNAIGLIRNPLNRARAFQRLSRKLLNLRLAFERLELVAGAKRRKTSLKKEAAMREALRREELVEDAMRRHEQVFSNADILKLKAQPVHGHLADPDSPLRGRLMSKSAALKRHPDMFVVNRPGDYDGADGISRSVFGGTLMPDQAAQELFENHLIQEPTTDALWEALAREQSFVDGMKEYHAKALEAVREAKAQAKEETNEWLREQETNQEANFSDKQEILRALAVLDGVLSIAPAEIRGKVGGYTRLARLGSNETRMAFLKDRLAMVDREMEAWLKKQYHAEFMDLLKRAKPSRDAPGEKPTGKIGADLHDLFAEVEKAMRLTSTEADAEAAKLEALAASGDYSADEEAHKNTLAGLIRLAGAWYPRSELRTNPATGAESYVQVYPGADAARMEEALIEATRIFEKGYWENRVAAVRKREARTTTRRALEKATGRAGTPGERDERENKDAGLLGSWGSIRWSLASFDQLMIAIFGENSAEARRYADAERWASDRKTDAVFAKTDALTDLFTELAGGALEGEKLRFGMSRKVHKVGERTLSELEMITATLMWRQEDGRRHMMGHQDENGGYTGKWHYDQAFIDRIEAALSPEAKAVRLHLSDQYEAEYDRLNAVYRNIYGVNLPRHKFYSPLTVVPQQVKAGQEVDPVTGFAGGGGFTPGSLKTRSADAIAEPQFRDALQTYIGHVKQMEHWMAYAGLTQEMNMVLNNRDLRAGMEAKAGREAIGVLSQWVEHFSLGGTRDAAAHLALTGKLAKWTNRAASIALVGRFGVLAIQSTQLGAAVAEMPTGAYLKRLGKLTSGQLGWGEALKTEYIQRRLKQLPPVVQQALEGLRSTKPSRLKHEVAKLGNLIGGADALFTAGTYAICYDYHLGAGLKSGLSQAEAAKAAHSAAKRACDRLAQPTRAGARSLYENTATGPLARLSWAFASEGRQKLALAAFTLANPDASAGRKARAVAVAWLIGGGLATLIRTAWRDMKDDDDEWLDEKNWNPLRLGLSMLTGPLQGIPVIGDTLEAIIFKSFGQYLPDGNLFTPIARAPGAVKHIPDWFTGERDFGQALQDAEAILSGMGILNDSIAAAASLSHLARDVFGLSDNLMD